MTPFAVTCVKYEPDTHKTFGLVTTPEFRQIIWVSGQVDAIQFTDLVKPWVERKLGEFWTMIPLIEGNPRRGGELKAMTTFQHIAADADEAAAEQLYLGLCETFKTWLSQVASEYGKPVEQVFDWWREYTRDCRNFDQSPVQSEFLDWYRDKLAQASVEPPI